MDSDQPVVSPSHAVILKPEQTVGQTFVAQHGGLNGIELWLEPSPDAEGILTLRLREDFNAQTDLAIATALVKLGSSSGFYRFSWAADTWSHSAYRYAFVSYQGRGEVKIGANSGDSYIHGAAYLNHQPASALQLTFRLTYDLLGMVVDLSWASIKAFGLLLLVAATYILPGYAFLTWIYPETGLPLPGRIALSLGASIAVYPLLIFWSSVLGWQLGIWSAGLPILVSILALVLKIHKRDSTQSIKARLQTWYQSEAFLPDLSLGFVLLATLATRLLVMRTLPVPLGSDSYHHSLVTQLLVENSGLFSNWGRYAPLQSFTYHFGFHTSAAVWHWLTRLPPHESVFFVGQTFNGLAALALYPVAFLLYPSRWSGTVATLMAGLLLPMPAFYINWGRYPQITGQIILATLVTHAWLFSQERKLNRRIRIVFVLALVFAGLLLTHYRVSAFFVLFLLSLWVVESMRQRRAKGDGVLLVIVFLFGILLTLPWWTRVLDGMLDDWVGRHFFAVLRQRYGFWIEFNRLRDLDQVMHPLLWLTFVLGIGYALWARNSLSAVFGVWFILLLLLTNPEWVGLPGGGMVGRNNLAISAYAGATPFQSLLIVSLVERFPCRRLLGVLLTAVSLALAVLGVPRQLGIVERGSIFVTSPDLRAMEWMNQNLPRGSKVFAEPTLLVDEVVVGSDAGWWLPLLTHHKSNIPPLTYLIERAHDSNFQQEIADSARKWSSAASPAKFLRDLGFEYVYVGQRISDDHLLRSRISTGDFETVYARDRVIIAKVR
ncbi:MAG: hypothetical protein RML84_06055 [Anaerolineae bacterium]|nr:hypothetical protein [Anaerolineae bacterium]